MYKYLAPPAAYRYVLYTVGEHGGKVSEAVRYSAGTVV